MTDNIKDGPAFQLYAADFYMDTLGWDCDDIGAYFRLLMAEWVNGSLPVDISQLAKITQKTPKKFTKNWKIFNKKFHTNGSGNLINDKLEKVREKQRQYKENQAESGRRGIEAKKKKGIFPFDKSSDPSSDSASENQALQSSSSFKDLKNKDIQLSVVLRDSSIYEIGPEKVREYQQAYQKIDVTQELKNCAQWNKDNPGRRKTKAGILRHINTWLSKANKDKGYISKAPEPDTEEAKYRGETLKKVTPESIERHNEKMQAIVQSFLNKSKVPTDKPEYTKAEVEEFIKEHWPSKNGKVPEQQAKKIERFIKSVKIKGNV